MQLRKAIGHPYLFPGIEPEPFEIGEHLGQYRRFFASSLYFKKNVFSVEASGKLHILDHLLAHLYAKKHKVLLFSQFTSVLDILQDYLTYRETYKYERREKCREGREVIWSVFAIGLDGSVRSEERFLAINNFNGNDDTFIFLLSTRAGEYPCIDNWMVFDESIFLPRPVRGCRSEPCRCWYGDLLRFRFQPTKRSASGRSMPSDRTEAVRNPQVMHLSNKGLLPL